MGDNTDIDVGEHERESLPAHVEACSRRYAVLRKDIRHGNDRVRELSAAVTTMNRLIWAVLIISALSGLGEMAPTLKSAAVATVSRALAGG